MRFIKTKNGNILNVGHISGFYIEENRRQKSVDNVLKWMSFFNIWCWISQCQITYTGKKYSVKKEPTKLLIEEFLKREQAEEFLESLFLRLNEEKNSPL